MHRITIRQGVIRLLYTDTLPLERLGPITVTRASHVEFDEDRQGWTVTLADGTQLPGCWPKRSEALAAEVEAVNARL